MSKRLVCWSLGLGLILGGAVAGAAFVDEYKSGIVWPKPAIIDVGPGPATSAPVPSDAIVLFDGKDLSGWQGGDQWIVADGVATTAKGGITSKQAFGDCQVHLEFATPEKVEGNGQGRGNSGLYLMGQYEVQILDSHDNETYFDGQCGSIYKQQPPMVNASRKPGEWQTFDIVFRAPRFDTAGAATSPARMTVHHNGVLVQDNVALLGPTTHMRRAPYEAHADRLPVSLQDHGDPVRYRNIWVRELRGIGKGNGK